jgi:hypothetical protein
MMKKSWNEVLVHGVDCGVLVDVGLHVRTTPRRPRAPAIRLLCVDLLGYLVPS